MSSDKSGFLVSAAIVAVGIGGLWAFPTMQEEGLQGFLARLSGSTAQKGSVVPDGTAGVPQPDGASIAESLAPGHGLADPSVLVAASAPDIGAACDERQSEDRAVVGDRLQLRFFERSALAAVEGPGGIIPASDIVFERLDLSGLYEIDATSSTSLPAIGHVALAGRSLACIEAVVARAAFEAMGVQATVTAAFAARPPVLVRGAVRAPGSYGHSPGLTVERVLAQAGLLDSRDSASQARLIALKARRTDLERSRAAAALERMRVSAMIAGMRTLPEDDPLLQEILRAMGAERLAAEERALIEMLDAEDQRAASAREGLADLNERINIASRQQTLARQQMNQYNARLEQQSLRLRNLQVRDQRLEDTKMRAVDSERILLEKQDLLLRLQAERRQSQLESTLFATSRDRDLTTELRRLETAIASAETELMAIAAEERLLDADTAKMVVTIAGPDGSSVMAEANTPVRPGDLVTVSVTAPPPADNQSATLVSPYATAIPHDIQSASIK